MRKFIQSLFIIFMISGCSQTASTHCIERNNQLTGLHSITYQELTKKMETDDSFVLYIGRTDCIDCQSFHTVINSYFKHHQGTYAYYLDIKQYRDAAKKSDATKEEKDFYDRLYETFDMNWTPSVRLIHNGKIVDKYQYRDEDYYQLSSSKQKDADQKYEEEFEKWMNEIFEVK